MNDNILKNMLQKKETFKEWAFLFLVLLAFVGVVTSVAYFAYGEPVFSKETGIGFKKIDVAGANESSVIYSQIEERDKEQGTLDVTSDPFGALSLTARTAFVLDGNNDLALFSKNPDSEGALASVTKVMTAYVASKILPAQADVVITKEHLEAYGSDDLREGQVWKLADLSNYTLVTSSNDGAIALAQTAGAVLAPLGTPIEREEAFVAKMNEIAKEIGMSHTKFTNPHGLDDDWTYTAMNTSSTRDVALLFKEVLKNNLEIFEKTGEQGYRVNNSFINKYVRNTNKITSIIPNLIASKTGYTDTAGGNLAVVYDADLGYPVVIVVLGSTREGRFQDVKKLVDATAEFLR